MENNAGNQHRPSSGTVMADAQPVNSRVPDTLRQCLYRDSGLVSVAFAVPAPSRSALTIQTRPGPTALCAGEHHFSSLKIRSMINHFSPGFASGSAF
jgi:hypothetical protein